MTGSVADAIADNYDDFDSVHGSPHTMDGTVWEKYARALAGASEAEIADALGAAYAKGWHRGYNDAPSY